MSKNVLSDLYSKYQGTVTSPIMQAAILASITLPPAYYLRNPLYRSIMGYSLQRAKTPQQQAKIIKDMHNFANSGAGKWGLPILGLTPAAVSLILSFRPLWKGYGWTQWGPVKPLGTDVTDTAQAQPGLVKTLSMWGALPYTPTASFSMQVNPGYITGLIKQNPVLSLSAYAQNLGTAILNAAPTTGFNTTLGNIYDSAVNKFDKKLSFSGLTGSAVKGVIAGSMAGMFTDVVGAMAGLPKSVMDPISGDVSILNGVGTALKSILL